MSPHQTWALATGPYTKKNPTRCWPHGKIRYRDSKDAKKARRDRESKGAPNLRVYRCPHCGGWHLTSQRKDSERKDDE